MPINQIALIGVPSSAGARRTGQDRAPYSFRAAGLVESLQAAGIEVTDRGDLDHVIFQPDLENPTQQNLALVVEMANRVASIVSKACADNEKVIVLGGDCTISLGVLAGLIRRQPDLGLIYFDGDVDLNTPDTTSSGIFDGMVMSHITGEGAEALTHVGSRYPLMAEENIVLFGYNVESGWIDEAELHRLEKSSMMRFPASQVRGNGRQAATQALAKLEAKVQRVLVHFDVDVIDCSEFAAADVPHDKGLSFNEAMEVLRVFVSSPKFAGLVITEFNADRDADGTLARGLMDGVVKILAGGR